jgi:succinate-acetate transporter protein
MTPPSESAIDRYCTAKVSLTHSKAKPPTYLVVRYLDGGAGTNANKSAGRLWKDPPAVCNPRDIRQFLQRHGILNEETPTRSTRCEVFLDNFSCYVDLNECEEEGIIFDFTGITPDQPGLLSLRLTDVSALYTSTVEAAPVTPTKPATSSRTVTSTTTHEEIPYESDPPKGLPTAATPVTSQPCNTAHIGLFAFSFGIWIEAVQLLGELVDGSVSPNFALVWGPFAFFSSGMLMVIVGLNESKRNNVFGTTIFLVMGSSWVSTGFVNILVAYFPDGINPLLLQPDPLGKFLLCFWYILFIGVVVKQTFSLSRFATTMVAALLLLCTSRSLSGWSRPMQWIQLIAGVMAASTAFYGFMAEFTNEMYHRSVFNLYPWKATTAVGISDEVWGAPGRVSDLRSRVSYNSRQGRHWVLLDQSACSA